MRGVSQTNPFDRPSARRKQNAMLKHLERQKTPTPKQKKKSRQNRDRMRRPVKQPPVPFSQPTSDPQTPDLRLTIEGSPANIHAAALPHGLRRAVGVESHVLRVPVDIGAAGAPDT